MSSSSSRCWSRKIAIRVESATGLDANLKLEPSLKLHYPKAQWDLPTDESLKGATFLISNGSFYTPPGTYSISFTEPVSADSVVIMIEPAMGIRMRTTLADKEQEVTNLKDVFSRDEIDVLSKIYEIGTDNEVDPKLLCDSVAYHVAFLEDDAVKQETSDSSLIIKGIRLEDMDSELKGTIEIPGFVPMTYVQRFHPMLPVQYTMTVATPEGAFISRVDLYRNTKGMVFTIYGDGVALRKAQAADLNLHFTLEDPFGE